MSVSLYSVSVPVFVRMLGALDHVLARTAEDAALRERDPAEMLAASLAPDMFPLKRQVQLATDHAKGAVARLSGRKSPHFADDEISFADLSARLSRTIDYVGSVAAGDIDGNEVRTVTIRLSGTSRDFTAEDYLLHFAMPNFYFHVGMAYAIVRHFGAPVGKLDYLWQG